VRAEARLTGSIHERTMWNKDYLLLLAGQWVSQVGTFAYTMALPMYVLQVAGSKVYLGLVMAASLVPLTLLGPFAGVMADRWPRKWVIVCCDLLSGAVVLLMSLLASSGGLTVGWLVATAALLSTINSFFFPAVTAAVPNLVPRDGLTRSMSLLQGGRHIGMILGPAFGGVLIACFGFPVAFFINGASFVISGLTELLIAVPQATSARVRFIWEELKTGWRFVLRTPTVLAATGVMMVINLFEPAVIPLILPVAADSLGVGVAGYSTMRIVFALGCLAATALLALTQEQQRKGRLIALDVAAIGVIFCLMGSGGGYWVLLLWVGLYGLAAGVGNTLIVVIIQELMPDPMRGRVFGVIAALAAGLMPISYLGIGGLLEVWPWSRLLLICGFATLLGAAAYYSIREIRED